MNKEENLEGQWEGFILNIWFDCRTFLVGEINLTLSDLNHFVNSKDRVVL